jgi:hypothetical protein
MFARFDDNDGPFVRNPSSGLPHPLAAGTRGRIDQQLTQSALCRKAIAPQWDVDAARSQQNAGDPNAGLTEQDRAAQKLKEERTCRYAKRVDKGRKCKADTTDLIAARAMFYWTRRLNRLKCEADGKPVYSDLHIDQQCTTRSGRRDAIAQHRDVDAARMQQDMGDLNTGMVEQKRAAFSSTQDCRAYTQTVTRLCKTHANSIESTLALSSKQTKPRRA